MLTCTFLAFFGVMAAAHIVCTLSWQFNNPARHREHLIWFHLSGIAARYPACRSGLDTDFYGKWNGGLCVCEGLFYRWWQSGPGHSLRRSVHNQFMKGRPLGPSISSEILIVTWKPFGP
jgi:hypothetical protein